MNAIPGKNSNLALPKTMQGKDNFFKFITKSKFIRVVEDWLMASGRLA